MRKNNTIEDFWKKVDIKGPDDCWNWLSTKNELGYGFYRFNKKFNKSHRLSYIFTFGEIPEGLCVCHKCDNPSCVNPNHLFLGTMKDNTQDMIKKGRAIIRKGEKHHKAKLTEEQVLEIRCLYKQGISQKDLAFKYNISIPTISQIINNILWKHI